MEITSVTDTEGEDLVYSEPDLDTTIKENRAMLHTEPSEVESTALADAVRKNNPGQLQRQDLSVEGFILKAIESNVSVETLDKLLAMRERIKAEQAKEAYTAALAAFQGECPTIKKTKPVKNDQGKVIYMYAPIESIVDQVKELLAKHELSYTIQTRTDEKTVTSVCVVRHAMGHSESSDMTVPIGGSTKVMSPQQGVAASLTFAKRYAFLNALGIMTGDEDSETALQETQLKNAALGEYETKLRGAKTLIELTNTYNGLPAIAKKEFYALGKELKQQFQEAK